MPLVPGEEVLPVGGVDRDLGQRPVTGLQRVGDHRVLDDHPRCDRRRGRERGAGQRARVARAAERVEAEEGDRAENAGGGQDLEDEVMRVACELVTLGDALSELVLIVDLAPPG